MPSPRNNQLVATSSSCLKKNHKFNLYFVIFLLVQPVLITNVIADCGCSKNRKPTMPKDSNPEREPVDNIQIPKLEKIENLPDGDQLTSGYLDENLLADHHPLEDKSWMFEMTLIRGGEKLVGVVEAVIEADGEFLEHTVDVKPFYMDRYEVSIGQFEEFVRESNYVTEAETFGDSFVFQQQLTDEVRAAHQGFRVVGGEWWYKIKGVDWRHPEGPNSTIVGREKFPVTHMSWNDAVAYCKWRNKRLPTEIEWETACRGGKKGKLFPWGNKMTPKNKHW